MAKIKINSLPEGFELKDGKIVEIKKHGGFVTGDQQDYGLTTFTGSSEDLGPTSADVRYSLASVPRDQANLEAEGGETVLTDLNNDGEFGLYDIKGPRHGSGGVPMFLPEQSFIYSDTKKLKFTKSEMQEMDITSKKKLTPAKISKNFQLNEYYGKINDEFADDMQVRSAELMLDKNKPKLSKLAFMQELKKDFADGVPLASHPHLVSIGVDPIEFTSKVEGIKEEEARQKTINALPFEQRKQLEMLQQMLASAEQPKAEDQSAQPAPIPLESDIELNTEMQNIDASSTQIAADATLNQMPPEMMPPQGLPQGLPQAQKGNKEWRMGMKLETPQPPSGLNEEQLDLWNKYTSLGLQAPSWLLNTSDNPFKSPQVVARDIYGETTFQPSNTDEDAAPAYNENYDPTDPEYYGYQPPEDNVYQASGANIMANGEGTFVPETADGNQQTVEESPEHDIEVVDPDSGAKRKVRARKITIYDSNTEEYREMWQSNDGEVIDGALVKGGTLTRPKHQGRVETTDGHYYGAHDISTLEAQADFEGRFPWVKDLEGYNYSDGSGAWVLQFQRQYKQKAKELANKMNIPLEEYAPYNFFKDETDPTYRAGEGFDRKFGTHTYSAYALAYDAPGITEIVEEEGDDPTTIIKESPAVPGYASTRNAPSAQWWLQDLLKMNAIAQRDREMFLPFQPPVTRVEVDYALEDPTRAIAAINEQLAINTKAAGAFGGPQSLAARTAQAQGKAATAIADEIGRVNSRNVGTINRGKQIQARFDTIANQEQDRRQVKEYDDTQRVLQLYTDERNFDREQYADALANAVTNRANTYNLNSIQDYYRINPMSGGKIGQFSSKAFDLVKQRDPYGFIAPYAELAKQYKGATGQDPTNEIMQGLMTQYAMYNQNISPEETNIQQEMRANPLGGYGQKHGGEKNGLKRYATPFYVGQTGI